MTSPTRPVWPSTRNMCRTGRCGRMSSSSSRPSPLCACRAAATKTNIEFGFIDLRFDTHPDRDPKSGLRVRHWC
ncbi:hypothetical protein AGR13a_Lc60064 [Agrobacterium genomosp. 13 str. CFBP 6927]|uniref:Uncharacterized protein n=1 Tax=Agrobacterium genomosp. 13 str. CFBP 6927 TaxID=1183428 RepID=A0ABP2BQC2_9HYPH|nr:hypothetical protein AGR13a_Lc60064 [Agrobacterium genomosp. 13 str. CFBP 6927]